MMLLSRCATSSLCYVVAVPRLLMQRYAFVGRVCMCVCGMGLQEERRRRERSEADEKEAADRQVRDREEAQEVRRAI
jgi:hypothetical protein